MSTTVATAVVGVGVKGGDIVTSTFKKINKEKEKFKKPVSTKISAKGGKSSKTGGTDTDDKKEKIENEKAAKSSSKIADSLERIGGSVANLNPVELIRTVASATINTGGGLISSIAEFFSPKIGEIAKKATEYLNKITDFGIQAAGNSLAAYKSSLPTVAERNTQASLLTFGGDSFNRDSVSRSEAFGLSKALLPVIGIIKKTDKISQQLLNLFDDQKGVAINRDQAMSLAQGDFSALGTNKGWLLNQISQSFSGLPPEIAKAGRSALLGQVDFAKELAKEDVRARKANVGMGISDLATQDEIAEIGMSMTHIDEATKKSVNTMISTNDQMNKLTVNMVSATSRIVFLLNEAGAALNSFVGTLPKNYRKAKQGE